MPILSGIKPVLGRNCPDEAPGDGPECLFGYRRAELLSKAKLK
jgi:hypothetical protein